MCTRTRRCQGLETSDGRRFGASHASICVRSDETPPPRDPSTHREGPWVCESGGVARSHASCAARYSAREREVRRPTQTAQRPVCSRFSFPPRFREPGTSTWLRALHRALAAGPIWDAYHRAGSKASGIEQAATLKGSGPQDTSVGKCAATFRARSDAGGFPLLVHFNTRARRVTMTTANVRLGRRRRGAVAHPSG